MSATVATTSTGLRPCASWSEHEWGTARFVEAGTHPANGRYHRYVATCELCGRERRETHWFGMPATVPAERSES